MMKIDILRQMSARGGHAKYDMQARKQASKQARKQASNQGRKQGSKEASKEGSKQGSKQGSKEASKQSMHKDASFGRMGLVNVLLRLHPNMSLFLSHLQSRHVTT